MLRDSRDRGATGISFVLVMPVVIFAFMLLLQFAVKANADRAAQAAAEEGAAVARTWNGSSAAGEETAAEYAERMGDGVLHDVTVTSSRSAEVATVTVSGTATSLLGITIRVEETSSGPVERFAPEAGEGS